MGKPDFLVIGAQRSGTSTTYAFLKSHPQIFVPAKEINFFAIEGRGEELDANSSLWRNSCFDAETYFALFDKANQQQVLSGDVSPLYLSWPRTAENIYKHVPDVKIIAILRNPVDRALSHFKFSQDKGFESSGDFVSVVGDALADKGTSPRGYLEGGLYGQKLKFYYDNFPAEKILIMTYESLNNAPRQFFQKLQSFLGVKERYPALVRKYNRSQGRSKLEHHDRQRVLQFYREDIERLGQLTGSSFGEWTDIHE